MGASCLRPSSPSPDAPWPLFPRRRLRRARSVGSVICVPGFALDEIAVFALPFDCSKAPDSRILARAADFETKVGAVRCEAAIVLDPVGPQGLRGGLGARSPRRGPVELTTWRSPSALTFRLPPSSASAARPLEHVLCGRITTLVSFSSIFLVCFAHGFRLFVVGAARRHARSVSFDTIEPFTSISTLRLLVRAPFSSPHASFNALSRFNLELGLGDKIWIFFRRVV